MLNYRDAVLEPADAALYDAPNWLNDRCIHFGFKLLEDDLGDSAASVALVRAAKESEIPNFKGS